MTQHTFIVTGMTCGHCAASVQEEIADIAGVTAVNANPKSGEVTVEGEGFTTEQIAAAVSEAGYTLVR
ncbi:MAG: heavy-metal-associated domain-containing protein [Corynebacterium sp.]|nr:heavy-metal-associated domain-containing protein [Corynebacterium sp.]